MSATVFLWTATIAFYAAGGPVHGVGTPRFWLAAIIVVGPVLGVLGRASSTVGAVGALATGVIAGWLLGEAAYTAVGYSATGRWLSVTVDLIAMTAWILTARGPRRVVAAVLLPAATAPAAFLMAAGAVSSASFH